MLVLMVDAKVVGDVLVVDALVTEMLTVALVVEV